MECVPAWLLLARLDQVKLVRPGSAISEVHHPDDFGLDTS